MKDKPIIFSGPMIRALLAGTKTQTRRVVKPLTKRHPIVNLKEHGCTPQYGYSGRHNDPASWGFAGAEDGCDMPLSSWIDVLCPYGKPGDLLWVRETITTRDRDVNGLIYDPPQYRADFTDPYGLCFASSEGPRYVEQLRWTPAIHMPRSASRLTLRISNVRVERLCDISEEDAIAEGTTPSIVGANLDHLRYRAGYMSLWDSINGEGAWDNNPWVWALTLEVIKANIDAVLASI